MNWRDQGPDDALEDMRRLLDELEETGYQRFDPPEPMFLVSPALYKQIVKMQKRRAQRAARRERKRRKKIRGW